jgi:hypothetical protein
LAGRVRGWRGLQERARVDVGFPQPLDHLVGGDEARVIRIAITQAAFDAIAATLQLGSVAYEADRTEKGEVEPRWLDKLKAMHGPSERYSDVIIRLAASDATH